MRQPNEVLNRRYISCNFLEGLGPHQNGASFLLSCLYIDPVSGAQRSFSLKHQSSSGLLCICNHRPFKPTLFTLKSFMFSHKMPWEPTAFAMISLTTSVFEDIHHKMMTVKMFKMVSGSFNRFFRKNLFFIECQCHQVTLALIIWCFFFFFNKTALNPSQKYFI